VSCLIKIRSIRDEMSANEKKIADHILSNSALLRDYSSMQLANAVGVSQSSVVKFCQKLGYKGYPDLKLAINEAVAKNFTKENIRPKYFSNSELNTVSERLLQGKLEAVTATIESITETAFINASHAIKKAKKILIICSDNARYTGDLFASNLIHSGKVAFASSDKIYQIQLLNLLSKNDVVIFLSTTNEQDVMTTFQSDIRDKGMQIIRICPYSPNINYHISDISLSTISVNNGTRNEFRIPMRAAQQHIIEILLSLSADTDK